MPRPIDIAKNSKNIVSNPSDYYFTAPSYSTIANASTTSGNVGQIAYTSESKSVLIKTQSGWKNTTVGDQNWSKVVLLLSGGGDHNTPVTVDNSSFLNPVTSVGDACYSREVIDPFGRTSIRFFSAGSGFTIGPNSRFSLAGAPYTIEFWLYFSSATIQPATTAFINLYDYVGKSSMGVTFNSLAPRLFSSTNGTSANLSSVGDVMTQSVWNHVAVVYDGSNTSIFVNGGNPVTSTVTQMASSSLVGCNIGITGMRFVYFSDLRITKGVARYTQSFSPPTTPFSKSSG